MRRQYQKAMREERRRGEPDEMNAGARAGGTDAYGYPTAEQRRRYGNYTNPMHPLASRRSRPTTVREPEPTRPAEPASATVLEDVVGPAPARVSTYAAPARTEPPVRPSGVPPLTFADDAAEQLMRKYGASERKYEAPERPYADSESQYSSTKRDNGVYGGGRSARGSAYTNQPVRSGGYETRTASSVYGATSARDDYSTRGRYAARARDTRYDDPRASARGPSTSGRSSATVPAVAAGRSSGRASSRANKSSGVASLMAWNQPDDDARWSARRRRARNQGLRSSVARKPGQISRASVGAAPAGAVRSSQPAGVRSKPRGEEVSRGTRRLYAERTQTRGDESARRTRKQFPSSRGEPRAPYDTEVAVSSRYERADPRARAYTREQPPAAAPKAPTADSRWAAPRAQAPPQRPRGADTQMIRVSQQTADALYAAIDIEQAKGLRDAGLLTFDETGTLFCDTRVLRILDDDMQGASSERQRPMAPEAAPRDAWAAAPSDPSPQRIAEPVRDPVPERRMPRYDAPRVDPPQPRRARAEPATNARSDDDASVRSRRFTISGAPALRRTQPPGGRSSINIFGGSSTSRRRNATRTSREQPRAAPRPAWGATNAGTTADPPRASVRETRDEPIDPLVIDSLSEAVYSQGGNLQYVFRKMAGLVGGKKIPRSRFTACARQIGVKVPEAQVDAIFDAYDPQDRGLGFAAFVKLLGYMGAESKR